MEDDLSCSVGELAALAGVTIRTLHHYDEIGLLSPSSRTAAGYRRYGRAEVERLLRIMVYRELGFDLTGIARILDDPAVNAIEHLRQQRARLEKQLSQVRTMINGVEAMMNARKAGLNLTQEEMREVFGSFDPTEHADEVAQRWGNTDAHVESRHRTSSLNRDQWLRIRAEADEIEAAFAAALHEHAPADGTRAMDNAERHRQHISRWFYECSHDIHRGLAEMYVADPRFTSHYEDRAEGLAAYVRAAIIANAARTV